MDMVSMNLYAANYAAEAMRGTRSWAGYTESIHQFQRKPWHKRRLDGLIASGFLPAVDDDLNIIGEK